MFDVIILGGGIVGASAACILTQRDAKVLLIDQYDPGHDQGSSHGDSRMIRFDYDERIYVEMVRQSYDTWHAIAQQAGEPVMQQTGICNLGQSDSPQLAQIETNLSACDIPYERLTAFQSNTRFPQFHLEPGSETIYQADGGVLFAGSIVQLLWRMAQEGGAETITGERIESMDIQDNGHVTIQNRSGQTWSGNHLILTAGGWSSQWFSRLDLDIPLTVTQEQLAYFPAKDDMDHTMAAMPNCIDYHTPNPFYALPQVTVPGVKAGWNRSGPEIDPDHPLPLDEENLAAVQAFIQRRCPHLDHKPVAIRQCLYTNSLDYHFILDRHPGYPQIVIAAGFSGHGFKFGPLLGQILAALVYDETPPVPLDLFSIERFANPASLKKRIIA